MTEEGKQYLSFILQAINWIEDFTQTTNTFSDYQSDQKTKSAVEHQLGIIGEAAHQYNKLNANFNLGHVRQIIGLRNRIIPLYNDDAMIWVILKKHLPPLKKEISRVLNI